MFVFRTHSSRLAGYCRTGTPSRPWYALQTLCAVLQVGTVGVTRC